MIGRVISTKWMSNEDDTKLQIEYIMNCDCAIEETKQVIYDEMKMTH